MQVEIWSDVVCPWCYIGKRRFETAMERFAERHPDVELDIRYRAFMLDPGAAIGRSEPVRDAYERKFGGPEAADAIIGRVTAEAAKEGLDFRMDIAQRSNTLAAHRLLVLADRHGCQAELKERLLASYFTEGKAIGDVDVLVAEAAAVGIDPETARAWLDGDGGNDEVAEQLHGAVDRGITGVPSFVVDGGFPLPGAQDPEVFVKVLERHLS